MAPARFTAEEPCEPPASPEHTPGIKTEDYQVAARDKYPRGFPQQLMRTLAVIQYMVQQNNINGLFRQRQVSEVAQGGEPGIFVQHRIQREAVGDPAGITQIKTRTDAHLQQVVTKQALQRLLYGLPFFHQQRFAQGRLKPSGHVPDGLFFRQNTEMLLPELTQ